MSARRLALLLSFLPWAALLPAQSPPSSSTPDSSASIPTIHVTTRIVELDVVVSDSHSHPAVGLKASDFHLTEDGVPQTIDSFTERDAPPLNSPAAAPLPPNTFAVQPPITGNGVMTVIVLNNFGSFTREQLKSYFQTADITTPIAIFRIDWEGMHLVQGFTTQRSVLLEAANSNRIWPPLGPKFHQDPASFRVAAPGSPTQHLAAYLAGISGRINVVWLGGAPVGQMANAFPDESDPFNSPDPASLATISQMVGDLNHTADVRRLGRVTLYAILGGRSCFMLAGNEIVARVAAAGGRAFGCTDPKPALEQIAATGSHYYTISYRPTNTDWNGAYRKIDLDVTGYAQPPFTLRWSQLITGWADDVEPTLLYRHGYYARATPPPLGLDLAPAVLTNMLTNPPPAPSTLPPPGAPQHRLISVSPRGAYPGAPAKPSDAAAVFGSITPTQLHFTVTTTPAPQQEKIKPRGLLPPGNYLATAFREGPYRNYRIHYWVDPEDLHLVPNPSGGYSDSLQFLAIVYRDDGVIANSLSTVESVQISAGDLLNVQNFGITFDQTVAVPIYDNFFLRTVVAESATKRIGAIEIPVETIKLPPPPSLAAAPPHTP